MTGFDALFSDLSRLGVTPALKERFEALEARVPELSVVSAQGDSPFQAEGVLQGLPFYFRYRRGVASLALGANPVGEPLYSAFAAYGSKNDGTLKDEEFEELLVALIPHLARAPFRYQFKGRKVLVKGLPDAPMVMATDREELYFSWGHTAEEAYEKLTTVAPHLLSKGYSEPLQQEIFTAQAIDPVPLNRDERDFPETAPSFTVF